MKKYSAILSLIVFFFVGENYAQETALNIDEIDILQTKLTAANNDKTKVDILIDLANVYQDKYMYDSAINTKLAVVQLCKTILAKGDTTYNSKIARNLMTIADLYLGTGQPEQAKDYTLQARDYIKNNAVLMVYFYKSMTESLRMYAQAGAKPISEAEVYYDSLTQLGYKNYPEAWSKRIAIDLSFTDFYISQNDNKKALKYIARADSLGAFFGEDLLKSQIKYMYGICYYNANEFNKALPFLLEAEKKAATWSAGLYVELQRNLANCYGKIGDYKKAFEYYQKFAPLRDSIYTKAAEQSFADSEAKFQNKDKQQQIELKNVQIAENKKQLFWLLGGLALLLVVVGLLIVIYRNKKRTADILNTNNKKLESLNTALEEANQTKAKLFSIISHDLRSPISQVYQFLKLQQLNPDVLNEVQRNELSIKIQTATGSLLETMEDLLLWSKTQMTEFKTAIQPTKPHDVANQCTKLLQLNTDAKNIEISNTIPANLLVQTDPYYLQTIIRNLLQNAIKASPDKGFIQIDAVSLNNKNTITIKNSGGTFTQQQFEQSLNDSEAGKTLTGLGLRLVHELSLKINATITFLTASENETLVQISLPMYV